MVRLFAWVRFRICLVRNNPYVIRTTINGKQYLTIIKTGLRGAVWRRRFEIVREVDELPQKHEPD